MLSTHREPTKSDTQRLPSFQRIISETDQPKSPFSSSLDPLPSTTISRLARHESSSRQRATLCLSSTRSRVRTEISFRGSDDPCLCSLSASSSESPIEIFNHHLSNPDTLKFTLLFPRNIARSLDNLSIYRYLSARIDEAMPRAKNLTLCSLSNTPDPTISVNNDMNRPVSHFHPSSSMSSLPRGPLTQNGFSCGSSSNDHEAPTQSG